MRIKRTEFALLAHRILSLPDREWQELAQLRLGQSMKPANTKKGKPAAAPQAEGGKA